MERSKAGTKERSPDGLSLHNQKKERKEKRKNVYSNKKYLILQCLHT